MSPSERLRVRVAFGALGVVPVFLAGWLGYVQVGQAGELPRKGRAPLPLVAATADRQASRQRAVPAPRGSIVDRFGVTLAADRETYDVRARIRVPAKCRGDAELFRDWVGRVSDAFARALVSDPRLGDRLQRRDRACNRIRNELWRRWKIDSLPLRGKIKRKLLPPAEILVKAKVERLPVVEALRAIHLSKTWPTVQVDFLHTFTRFYPERELTHGIVGHTRTYWTEDGGPRRLHTAGQCGLEALAALEPRAAAIRRYRADGKTRPYFMAPAEGAPKPAVLHTTLDLELQRIAVQELREQAESGVRGDSKKQAKWGALVLVDLTSGDLLAAAAWHRDSSLAKGAAFTPYQSRFEPGSIVKPLVLAYANEVGALDWHQPFDCNPRSSDYRQRIARLGRARPVRDDHTCNRLDAHGILVNSSNIGAAYVGLLLEREQWQDYMGAYGFGHSLGWNLLYEGIGGPNKKSFRADTPIRGFRANSAISFSFGYELTATPLQIARAYLRMFRGLGSELRLVRGLDLDGKFHSLPERVGVGPALRAEVVERVRCALADVVSNDPHATGRALHARMLKEVGVDLHGVVGGKTGTAASRVGVGNNRMELHKNASFVGFLPADEPRWLAVSVLQKDDSASFYGGSYAAPPAVKLLLQCRNLQQRRDRRRDARFESGGQTRLHSERSRSTGSPRAQKVGLRSPGVTGWQATVGAVAARDTR
ncbi:MAG: penicillin-binding transpeptidase domain-containing protein [Planctomycetota bacterium]